MSFIIVDVLLKDISVELGVPHRDDVASSSAAVTLPIYHIFYAKMPTQSQRLHRLRSKVLRR